MKRGQEMAENARCVLLVLDGKKALGSPDDVFATM